MQEALQKDKIKKRTEYTGFCEIKTKKLLKSKRNINVICKFIIEYI